MKPNRQTVLSVGLLVVSLWPVIAAAESSALVVGIGATRLGSAPETWNLRWCPVARQEAENAFRALVRDARDESHFYSHPTRWFDARPDGFNPAVLLTDGATYNLAIPVRERVLLECRNLAHGVGKDDDCIIFLAGLGEYDGIHSWVYDRTGERLSIRDLLTEIPLTQGTGRRAVVARVFSGDGEVVGNTLYLADGRTAGQFREWLDRAGSRAGNAETAPDAGRLAPGMSSLLRAATPARMGRIRDRVNSGAGREGAWELVDFGAAVDSRPQEARIAVHITEVPVYEKKRKQGPLFTILLVETDKQIGVETTADAEKLGEDLLAHQLAAPVIAAVKAMLQGDVAESFEKAITMGETEYHLGYRREEGQLTIRYDD
jgi:hypothetical protein